MSVTTGVVLAAGEGTRLRPLTRNRPKPMLPAANRPILEYVLDALVDSGVERLVLVVGYRKVRVQEHFGPSYRDVPLEYVHQRKQLGSGHALLQAREAVDGPTIVVNGDRIIESDIVAETVDAFGREERPTLAVLEHPLAHQYGAVSVGERGLEEIVERPARGEYRLINAGIYVFDESVFDAIEATPRRDGELQLPDTIERLMDDGVAVARVDGMWVDATYPWDLLEVARQLLDRGYVGGAQRSPGVFVAGSARVHEDATLQGPVVVGPDSEVAAGAVVGPEVALGRNATVGANAVVARSVLDADARVGPNATLLDCVTGQDVTVGPNALVPGGPADVRVGDSVFEGERLGAVLADRVDVGGGVSFDPGALVGPGASVGVGAHVSGAVPDDGEVVR